MIVIVIVIVKVDPMIHITVIEDLMSHIIQRT